jgi:hypothetical protein
MNLFIPKNLERFPFLMMLLRGSHTHYPPPPNRLPIDIANDALSLIREHDLLTLTARMLSNVLASAQHMLTMSRTSHHLGKIQATDQRSSSPTAEH